LSICFVLVTIKQSNLLVDLKSCRLYKAELDNKIFITSYHFTFQAKTNQHSEIFSFFFFFWHDKSHLPLVDVTIAVVKMLAFKQIHRISFIGVDYIDITLWAFINYVWVLPPKTVQTSNNNEGYYR
jgi:hypothetical protein